MSQVNVPWFGEEGDPLLPENQEVEVKPFIRQYDAYQTYDRLSVPSTFLRGNDIKVRLFQVAYGSGNRVRFFTPIDRKTLMIERFSPTISNWCEGYSHLLLKLHLLFSWRSNIGQETRGDLEAKERVLGNNLYHFLDERPYTFPVIDSAYFQIELPDFEQYSLTITWFSAEVDTWDTSEQRDFGVISRQFFSVSNKKKINIPFMGSISLFSVVITCDNSEVKDFITEKFNEVSRFFLWDNVKDANFPFYQLEPTIFDLVTRYEKEFSYEIKNFVLSSLVDGSLSGGFSGSIEFDSLESARQFLESKSDTPLPDDVGFVITPDSGGTIWELHQELTINLVGETETTTPVDVTTKNSNSNDFLTLEIANHNYWSTSTSFNANNVGFEVKPFFFRNDVIFLINHPRTEWDEPEPFEETENLQIFENGGLTSKEITVKSGFTRNVITRLDENYTPLTNEEAIDIIDEYLFEYDEFDNEIVYDRDNVLVFSDEPILEFVRKPMTDSIRIKEIHACLEAQKYASYPSNSGDLKPRVANIGYYVERIARILGINVLPDGVGYKPKKEELKDVPDDGSPIELPLPYQENRWGLAIETVETDRLDQTTDVANLEVEHDGFAYEIISNKFVEDDQTGENTIIKQGGYGLVNNIPQLMQVILDDLDKALGLQESGAFTIRSVEDVQKQVQIDPNNLQQTRTVSKPKLCTYEGLHSLMAEIAFMDSEISRRSSQAEIASLKTLAICMELLGALGLPIAPKTFKAFVGTEEERGLDVLSEIYYPALKSDSPKITELIAIVMENIAPLLGNQVTLPEEEQEKIRGMDAEELQDYIQQVKDNIDASSQNVSRASNNQISI